MFDNADEYNRNYHNIASSYTLGDEYRMARNPFPLLLFTSENKFCGNLRKNNRQTIIIPSRSLDLTDQLWWRHNAKSEKALLDDHGEISDRCLFLSEFVCSGHTIVCEKWNNVWVTVNNDLLSLVGRLGNDFHLWLCRPWKSLANRLTRDKISLFTVTHTLFYKNPLCSPLHKIQQISLKKYNFICEQFHSWDMEIKSKCIYGVNQGYSINILKYIVHVTSSNQCKMNHTLF